MVGELGHPPGSAENALSQPWDCEVYAESFPVEAETISENLHLGNLALGRSSKSLDEMKRHGQLGSRSEGDHDAFCRSIIENGACARFALRSKGSTRHGGINFYVCYVRHSELHAMGARDYLQNRFIQIGLRCERRVGQAL